MSKQFRVFLLPSDAAALLAMLDSSVGIKIYDDLSPTSAPSEIPLSTLEEKLASSERPSKMCLASREDARISSNCYATRDLWIIDDQSECIEFSTCKLIGSILVAGRFYFQKRPALR